MPTTPRLALPYPISSDTADVPRDIQALADRLEALNAFYAPGDLRLTAAAAPAGVDPKPWLECNGAAVSRATYSVLFAAIGTAYGGGDGASTFNLPDLRGRSPVGQGQGDPIAGVAMTNRVLGEKVGEEKHKLLAAELAFHQHDQPAAQGFITAVPSGGFAWLANTGTYQISSYGSTQIAGGNQAHNNLGPSAVVVVLIKT